MVLTRAVAGERVVAAAAEEVLDRGERVLARAAERGHDVGAALREGAVSEPRSPRMSSARAGAGQDVVAVAAVDAVDARVAGDVVVDGAALDPLEPRRGVAGAAGAVDDHAAR